MTVLLCIPERHIARLLQVNLDRQGYRVLPTFSVDELFERMASEQNVALFVLDGDLGPQGLRKVVRTIRADEKHGRARIFVVGSRPDDDDLSDVELYLTKPSNFRDYFGGGPGPAAGAVVVP